MATITMSDDQLLILAAYLDRAKRDNPSTRIHDLDVAIATVETAAMELLYSDRAARRSNYRPAPGSSRESLEQLVETVKREGVEHAASRVGIEPPC